MGRPVDALVEPSVLKWARETAGYTIVKAAEGAEVDAADLEAWEASVGHPSVSAMGRLARLYKRPLALFYLPAPPEDFQPLHTDYRKLPGSKDLLTPGLLFLMRSANALREDALELAEILEEPPVRVPRIDPASIDDAEAFALKAREILGVTLAMQHSWGDPYTALRGWVRAVEKAGVIVSQRGGVDLQEMRGISMAHEVFPIIIINTKDSPRGRIFSLLHEFSHILLRHEALCNLESKGVGGDQEKFCNAAAAAILMPINAFASEPEVAGAPKGMAPWPPRQLQWLGRRYTASEEAVLRRLLTLGKTTKGFYEARRQELKAFAEGGSDGGAVPQHRKKLNEVGNTFASLAMEAYDRQAISLNDLSRYLDLKLRHLTPMRDELRGRLT